MRTIRSYVLREGRISPAQARACRELLPIHGVAYQNSALDFRCVFGRFAPTAMEIGFGMGEALAEAARANPARNYLGLEVYSPGVGSLLNRIEREGLTNLKIIQHDAADVLRDMIGPGSLHALHVFFPDPWPKKRHHKRRLVNRSFVALACDRLAVHGYIHLTTDWQPYAEEMFLLLSAEPRFKRELAKDRPRTKFEFKGEKAGRKVWDLLFVRIGE